MRKKIFGWIIGVLILSALLLVISVCSLAIGAAHIPLEKILAVIFEKKISPELSILLDIRLPRILLGLAIGGALSIAGVLLQGVFRNPLVEPYSLGISGGAALGVALNISFGFLQRIGLLSLPLSGFLGALLTIGIVYSLNIKRGVLKIQGLLLSGVMISFICSSLIMLIMAVSHTENLHGIIFWIMGSLEEPNWLLIKSAIVLSLGGLLVSYFFCHDLNALSLGEEEAARLGINVEKSKRLLFVIASVLTGVSVSIAGIIGFVGLVVPHFMRMTAGRDHRVLIITSYLCGAGFLVLCDTLSRTIIAPLELPVGVITGILGGSIFIFALTKNQ